MELPGGHAATSAEANDKFRSLMNTVSEMDSRAKARRRALLNLLEEDEDLAMMQLTKMREHPENYALPLSHEVEEDHEEVELLLESFLQEITSLSNVLEGMGSRMRNTETLIQARDVKLDIARNQLLTASTIFSLVAMCLSFGAVITGLFGMNLNNGHMDTADSHQWFIGVAISFATICLLWGGGTFWYFNRKGIWVS
ncbi:hypothetical protein JKP88DRAFT_319716 [Tribonema minus]|uniref:Magnesium transporter n=1 Tax=Tribonema minus TaxID=303371 RepID=A0A835YW71_9STRA|nr:hypothetical protein JKP88DRAFT_319716 [Tribonema minus]